MKMTAEVWAEVVNIINYEFVATRTPITTKLLKEAIIETQRMFEEDF